MRQLKRRVVFLAVSGLLLTALISGCTLTGANPAPVTTPVGDTGTLPTQEPTVQVLPPTPTDTEPIDVFGTQTAMAPTVDPNATEEGGEVTPPTGEAETAEPEETKAPSETEEPAGTEEPTRAPGDCPATHTVKEGQNLYRIALEYDITWQELASANGITNPTSLKVGQVLNIPRCGDGGSGGGSEGSSGGSATTHVVQPGENLYRIALKYGLTWQELAAYNNISDPNALYVGQVLNLPPH